MTNELVHFEKARSELAQATQIDEVKIIRDKAQALRAYVKQQGESLEMQNQCAEIKIRAERRAGELLQKTEKHKGGNPSLTCQVGGQVDEPVKLPELGITRNQSSDWQKIASIPEERFEKHISEIKHKKKELTTAGFLVEHKKLRKQQAKQERTERKNIKADIPEDESVSLIHCDISDAATHIEAETVDFIITDPPYPKQYLPTFESLAKFAAHALKPGGSLICMSGQMYLPKVFQMLGKYLEYHWTLAYLTPGGQAAQLWERKVIQFWKPLLWFTKGKYTGDWIGDVCKSDTNDNDKNHHHWGQSVSGIHDLMERFVYPGQTVCDPFLGGGATAIVAKLCDCRFIGMDIDESCLETTRGRLEKFHA